jgi:ubiquinone/menaquinone biosynthesis C-methylase UbiE
MTDKEVIRRHFTETTHVWRNKIYKAKQDQKLFEYFDKQYRFDYVVQMIDRVEKGKHRALDVGCGAGQLIPILHKFGYEAYAIDTSQEMIEIAKKHVDDNNSNCDIQLGDCENLNYPDNYFDVYVAMGVIEYLDSDNLMFEEIKRVLKPGGIAIITARNVRSVHVRWRVLYHKYFNIKAKNIVRSLIGKKRRDYYSISKEHNPSCFREQLSSCSFRVLEERYAHFHALPSPLNKWFSGLEAIMGKTMEKYFSRGRLPFMASTYIIKFQKIPNK